MWITFYQNLQNYYFHLNIYSTGAKPQFVRFYPSNSLKALKEGAGRKQMAHTEPCPCLGNSDVLSWGTVLCQGLHTHQQRELRVSPWGLVPPQQRLPPWNPGSERLFLHTVLSYLLQSHRMLGVGRDLYKTSSSSPPHTYLKLSLWTFISINEAQSLKNPKAEEWAYTPSSIHTHTHTHWEQPARPLLTPLGTGEGSGEKPLIRQRWRCKASSTILN